MILIADDQPETGLPLVKLLRHAGYDAERVLHGRDVLEVTQAIKPECIILDIMMPELSGFDVLKTLRERPAMADVPVLIYSCSGSAEIRRRAAKLGANDYATKSTTEWPELLAKINGLCHPERHEGREGTGIGSRA